MHAHCDEEWLPISMLIDTFVDFFYKNTDELKCFRGIIVLQKSKGVIVWI